MASSGSSGRPNSKAFNYAADDILCSYEDYGTQDSANGNHSEPAIGVTSSKDFHKSRMGRSAAAFPATSYSPQEDTLSQDVISAVDKTMKKYADNLMRFLEGISSRMSQLELYCYNVDKSIAEIRSDLARNHEEADTRLKSLEKHMQEVHRSVRILRDKQELAETQKELAKLQLAQKETPPQPEERVPVSSNPSETSNNQQLALALPHQVPPPQHPHNQYIPPPDHRYQEIPQTQSNQAPPPPPPPPQQQQLHSLPHYQQQWSPQIRPPIAPTTNVYTYPTQPSNSSVIPPDMLPGNNIPLQVSFPGIPHTRPESIYGYGGGGMMVPNRQGGNNSNAYMIYDGEGPRTGGHHPFAQGGYPPAAGAANMMVRSQNQSNSSQSQPQFVRNSNNPYMELIEKLVNMGYMGNHVVDAIQRMEESGQGVDFNSVLDRLNGSQRGGW